MAPGAPKRNVIVLLLYLVLSLVALGFADVSVTVPYQPSEVGVLSAPPGVR